MRHFRTAHKFDRSPYNEGELIDAPYPTEYSSNTQEFASASTMQTSIQVNEPSSVAIEGGRVECFIHQSGEDHYVGVRYIDAYGRTTYERRDLHKVVSTLMHFDQ